MVTRELAEVIAGGPEEEVIGAMECFGFVDKIRGTHLVPCFQSSEQANI